MVRRFSSGLVLLACALLVSFGSSSTARAGVAPRVLAFYYAWFDANTWTPNQVSDMPVQTYNSSDPATISRHIDQAKLSGIDAFVVSWIGQNNPTDWNTKTLLATAQSKGFSATIDFEVEHFGSRDQIVSALSYVRDALMTQPAFLRDNGRPVLFFWREQNFSNADWTSIRAQVDPDHQQLWIAEGVDISYQQVFDGHHLYSIAWAHDVNATLNDWGGRVRRAGADKIWVATVMPGYDDTRTDRPDRFARLRDGGDMYRSTWQAAINSRPDWIIITSFNEWVEGSQIEPSVSYGNLYLDLTRQFAARYKSGAPLPPPATPRPIATTSSPIPLEPNQRRTTDILRVREGPGQDYAVLGRLRANRTIQVLGRTEDDQWLEIAYPDADHPAWVASAYLAPQSGMDSFPIATVEASMPSVLEADAAAGISSDTPTPTPGLDDTSDGNLPNWY